MNPVLYIDCDNPASIYDTPCNVGARELLGRLSELRAAEVTVVNTHAMSDEARAKKYFEFATWPAAKNHYRVKCCFGRAGTSFGRGVPALVIPPDANGNADVYPHERKGAPGLYVTIADFLRNFGK